MLKTAQLTQEHDSLRAARPSQIANTLDDIPDIVLLAAWLLIEDEAVKHNIQRYAAEWRHIKPITDGHTLQSLGLKPGPRYKQLLDRVRAARLDGEVQTDDEEQRLVLSLMERSDDDL